MGSKLRLTVENEAREQIGNEFGSQTGFVDRLDSLVKTESAGEAKLAELAEAPGSRGGDIYEILSGSAEIVAALAPIIVAWLGSRGFKVEFNKNDGKGSETTIRISLG